MPRATPTLHRAPNPPADTLSDGPPFLGTRGRALGRMTALLPLRQDGEGTVHPAAGRAHARLGLQHYTNHRAGVSPTALCSADLQQSASLAQPLFSVSRGAAECRPEARRRAATAKTKEMMQPCLNLVHPLHDISLVPRGHRKVRFGAVNFVIRSSDDPRLAAEQISDGTMCAGRAWSKPQMWDTI